MQLKFGLPSLQVARSGPIKAETSAKLKVAINGFGRIGRNYLRCLEGREDSPVEVVAVNDSGGVKNVSEGVREDPSILYQCNVWLDSCHHGVMGVISASVT